jgi:hypothetical protein
MTGVMPVAGAGSHTELRPGGRERLIDAVPLVEASTP